MTISSGNATVRVLRSPRDAAGGPRSLKAAAALKQLKAAAVAQEHGGRRGPRGDRSPPRTAATSPHPHGALHRSTRCYSGRELRAGSEQSVLPLLVGEAHGGVTGPG